MTRVVFVVLDGVGVGALPDAAQYGDAGSDTLGNLSRALSLRLPFMQQLGLGHIEPIIGVPPVLDPLCLTGRLLQHSAGKDTTVGHWEHMGLITTRPFPTYPDGFPEEILAPFVSRIGHEVLGNRAASGTSIIAELGEEHLASGRPIVYTSADSVFQVAAHVDVVPLAQLYSWCETARELLQGGHAVARVIARPFKGAPGAFMRTEDRRDYSLPPPGPTYLDLLGDAGVPVLALGKISEIFAGRGVRNAIKVRRNSENLALVRDLLRRRTGAAEFAKGLLMTNLVDFDMAWGHRNDVEGFASGLEEADAGLADVLEALGPKDRLIVTADHGVDPTTPRTDHSREYVPLLVYPRPAGAAAAIYEGVFADTGATVFEYLTGREATLAGESVDRLRPMRGWRRCTPVQGPRTGAVAGLPGRVGPEEAATAARWLEENLGPGPEMAVILGSGLIVMADDSPATEVSYRAIPYWRMGGVPGHPQILALTRIRGRRVGMLFGRIHEYEGFDLSEVQLPVRTLAAWGVRAVVLTSAGGGVGRGLTAGSVLVAKEVLDWQYQGAGGEPSRLEATGTDLLDALGLRSGGSDWVNIGVHASVPGPQYETAEELRVLGAAGVATVSMTPAAELRAAVDAGLKVAVVTVVTNVGDTTHAGVLEGSRRSAAALTRVISGVAEEWAVGA